MISIDERCRKEKHIQQIEHIAGMAHTKKGNSYMQRFIAILLNVFKLVQFMLKKNKYLFLSGDSLAHRFNFRLLFQLIHFFKHFSRLIINDDQVPSLKIKTG